MKKNATTSIIFVFVLLIISGCQTTEITMNTTNNSSANLGEFVHFEFESVHLNVGDELTIKSANYSEEIYLETFCEVPFNILKRKGGTVYIQIYPTSQDCWENMGNVTFYPGIGINTSEIPIENGTGLGKGEYKIKMFYSTIGPDESMREFNQLITIE